MFWNNLVLSLILMDFLLIQEVQELDFFNIPLNQFSQCDDKTQNQSFTCNSEKVALEIHTNKTEILWMNMKNNNQ